MKATTGALELGRIIEDFLVELQEHHFIGPCECCGFPVPSPFMDEDTHELLCRNCRIAHENGGHH